ncbi:MAG: hypothetical protein Ta2A_22480 [Treponemataceae bacterium]|nr:MAG: hypothetical protein Ta2A_22480 [Treponemataceae bacterium]
MNRRILKQAAVAALFMTLNACAVARSTTKIVHDITRSTTKIEKAVRLGTFSLADIETLTVDYSAGKVLFLEAPSVSAVDNSIIDSGDDFIIEETTWDNAPAVVTHENGTLSITGGKMKFAISFFPFFWHRDPTLVVYVPKSYRGNYNIKIGSGELRSVHALVSDGHIDIALLSGNIKLASLAAKTFTMQVTSGNAAISDSVTVTDAWTFRMTSGTANINNASGKGDAKITSGNLKLALKELTGDLSLSVRSGNITLLVNEKTPFNLDADAASGNINVRSASGKTQRLNRTSILRAINTNAAGSEGASIEHTITARVTSGNVNIRLQE